MEVDGDFEPGVVNTTVYLMMCSMQFTTFFINYQVRERCFGEEFLKFVGACV